MGVKKESRCTCDHFTHMSQSCHTHTHTGVHNSVICEYCCEGESVQRALYSIKRALYSFKRALCSIKRALHNVTPVCITSPFASTAVKERVFNQKSPIFYQKSPIFYQKSPIFYQKSPTQCHTGVHNLAICEHCCDSKYLQKERGREGEGEEREREGERGKLWTIADMTH